MNLHSRVVTIAVLISAATSSLHAQAQIEPVPSAKAVIERYVEAIGGREAILAQAGRHVRGTVELTGIGIRGTYESWRAADRYWMSTDLPGVETVEIGYDGTVGWATSVIMGPSLLSGRRLEQARESARLTNPLHEGAEISSLRVVGPAEFEGHGTWEVAITTVSGETYTEHFDRETNLLVGMERRVASPMGDVPTVVVLEDYRPVAGLLVPRVRRERMMGVEQVTTLTSVEPGPVAARVFEPPVAIRTLLQHQPPEAAAEEDGAREGRSR